MGFFAKMGKKMTDKAIKKATKNMAPKAAAIVSNIITALTTIITMLPIIFITSTLIVAVVAFDWIIEKVTAKANSNGLYSTFELKENEDDMTKMIQIKKNEDGEYYLDFVDDIDEKIEKYIEKMNNQSGYHNVPEDVEFFKKIIQAEVCMKFPDLGGKVPKDSTGFQGVVDVRRATPDKKIGEMENTGQGEKKEIEEEEIDDPVEVSQYEEIIKTWEANKKLKLINSAAVYKERESEIKKGEGTGVFDVQYKEGTEKKLIIIKESVVTYTGKYKSTTNPLTKEITVYVEIKYEDIEGYVKASNLISIYENENTTDITTSENKDNTTKVANYDRITSRAKDKIIGKPSETYTVAIAAGHNNTDNTGASARGLVEQDLTIKVAEKVEELLGDYSNIKVIQTGSTSSNPGGIKLGDRTRLAREASPDLCIQIHFNAGGGTGSEVIYKNNDGISQELAEILSGTISNSMGIKNRGDGSDIEKCGGRNLGIIENAATSGFPSVVTEGAFLDGDPDSDIIKNQNGVQKYAQGIVEGIDKYFQSDHKGYSSTDKNSENITQNIKSVIKNLKYIPPEEFDGLVGSGNIGALSYFTLDEDNQLITATWRFFGDMILIEKNPPVDLTTTLQQYIVPFEYLLFFYMDSNYEDFSEDLAGKILKSEVVIVVKDNVTTTKEVITTQTKTEATDSSHSAGWSNSGSTTTITEEVSTLIDVTYIDTWCVKTYDENSYSSESLGMGKKDKVTTNIDGTVSETNSSSISDSQVTGSGTGITGEKDEEGNDITYNYTNYERDKTNTSEISNKYESGKTKTESKEKTFVKLYQKHEMHKKIRTNGYLFTIIEENEKTANLLNLTKYLIYKSTGIDDGVVEYDFGEFKLEEKFENVSGGTSNLSGVPGKIADFLLSKGMPIEGVAAVLGNIEQECSFNPTCVTGNYIGIIQWGVLYDGKPSRGTFLKEYAIKQGKDWTDLDTQIKFMWKELNSSGYKSVKNNLMRTKDVNKSAEYFARHFEKCINSDGSIQQLDKRQNYAEKWYNQLKSKYTPGNNSNTSANEIVNEALKYVGNPYVWGGSSLTNGCDCSHFVWLILKKVGAIPKNAGYLNTSGIMSSAESSWNCTKIGTDPNKAQPGDIIIYRPGNIHHAAIYMGNGKIVEAQSSNTGITSNRTLAHEAIAGIFRPKK